MKKGFAVISCTCLVLAVAMGFPRLSASHTRVDTSGCRECHELGEFTINGLHGMHTECFACHDGPTELGTVHASSCLACHPGSMPGTSAERCDLIVFHEGNFRYRPSGASCLSMGCHIDECPEPATTCPSKEIYGEGSLEVMLLRALRDNLLSQTPEGQELIKLYYRWSPVMVKAMEEDEAFREDFKNMIDELLPMIEKAVE